MARGWMVALVAMLTLWTPVRAFAQVAQLNPWTGLSTTAPGVTTINTAPVNITVSAGANRILLVAAVMETGTAGTLTNFNATLGGTAQWIREQQQLHGAMEDLLAEPPPVTIDRRVRERQ